MGLFIAVQGTIGVYLNNATPDSIQELPNESCTGFVCEAAVRQASKA